MRTMQISEAPEGWTRKEKTMKTVWKYPFSIDDHVTLTMPYGAQILSVQEQDGRLCMWALVDPDVVKENRNFRVYGTGHPIAEDAGLHVGTVLTNGGSLVWHVFEELDA